MTEAEWLTSEDPTLMLEFLRGKASERKCLLFVCACLRVLVGIPLDERYWRGIDMVEYQPNEWSTLREAAQAIKERLVMNQDFETAASVRDIERAMNTSEEGCDKATRVARRTVLRLHQRYLSRAICDIFGNPFRPVSFDPAWRSDTAVSLARHIYDSRDFSPMPILADALQDIGCDNADILNHCRDEKQVHVRGCWVVDLVLGKA